jgi:7-cyano-7-deazaguanine synthase
MEKSVVLLSGGLDSAVAAALEREAGRAVSCLAFRYGQRHAERECVAAHRIAREYGWPLEVKALGPLGGSALTCGCVGDLSSSDVVVPVRNLILCSHAAAYASLVGADRVVIGSHIGDHALFPDCRPEFFAALNAVLWLDGCGVQVHAPFRGMTKAQVVAEGRRLGVPLELTWSCYVGGNEPCRECLACLEREKAMEVEKEPTEPAVNT